MIVETTVVESDFFLGAEEHKEFHIITFADMESSMLGFYGDIFGLNRVTLKKFAFAVNDKYEVGSLVPLANISAVPKRLLLDFKDPEVLFNQIIFILRENQRNPQLMFGKILFDFRNAVGPFVVKAITKAVNRLYGAYRHGNGTGKDLSVLIVGE